MFYWNTAMKPVSKTIFLKGFWLGQRDLYLSIHNSNACKIKVHSLNQKKCLQIEP